MEHLLVSLPTAVDLLALVMCLGTLSSRLWVVPHGAMEAEPVVLTALRAAVWRLLGFALVALTLSSAGELMGRTLTMSGLPLAMLGRVLPIVVLRTHYGRVWWVRLGGLALLWSGWCLGRRRLHRQSIPAGMLAAGALLALTRSLAGHAADWGDVTFAVLADWLHLLAGGLWGGGLWVLAWVVLPRVNRHADQHRPLLADLARRFARLASLALAVVLLTGLANAWVEVGRVQALWLTPYGRTLLTKLFLVGLVVVLGAVHHYLAVPRLQQWAGRPVAGGWPMRAVDRWTRQAAGGQPPAGPLVAQHWQRTVGAEGLLLLGVLLCTVLLLHSPPLARCPTPCQGRRRRQLHTTTTEGRAAPRYPPATPSAASTTGAHDGRDKDCPPSRLFAVMACGEASPTHVSSCPGTPLSTSNTWRAMARTAS
jgi:putative copper export protein